MQTIPIIESSDAWQRLDKFLKKFFPNLPLWAMYKMLRTGKIKVSGRKREQNYRLITGDTLELYLSEEEINTLKAQSSHSADKSPSSAPSLDIIYNDESLIVINKPAWINVHPGDHKTKELSLIELIHDALWNVYNSLTFKPSLVHRIDRDTSGCIMVALTKPTLEHLLNSLQRHEIDKVYHAIVVGVPEKPTGTISVKLLRKENAKDEAKVVVSECWQRAITHYRVLRTFSLNWEKFSLLECSIETGRTHQIRVHLAYIGCPIVGDKAYWNLKINAFIKNNYWVSRQLLHAFSLEFLHPSLQKKIRVEAPYRTDMKKLLSWA